MKYILIPFLLIIPFLISAQVNPVQPPVDTIPPVAETIDTSGFDLNTSLKTYFTPKPKKALILSLAVPGGGQIYNRRWWKLPLVYGALGGVYAVIDFNQTRYRRFKTALDLKRAGDEHEFSGTQFDNEETLLTIRNGYDKNTQVSYFAFILVYTLQALEAFVDAHLKNFDMSDDLSLHIKPTFELAPGTTQPTLGIGLSIPLNGKASPLRQTTFPMGK